jgi:hypothetical protein
MLRGAADTACLSRQRRDATTNITRLSRQSRDGSTNITCLSRQSRDQYLEDAT